MKTDIVQLEVKYRKATIQLAEARLHALYLVDAPQAMIEREESLVQFLQEQYEQLSRT
ncbi:hypothetical protein [Chthonobacter rhizosphaerae]|uniref:hypothetical protein n=1 Tax=Chthonobacter rhizosphaerae TaxID=2735553 RepID=UPI0015EFB148|nr:hypothetical protein [Chthonobacter rhizosphaerae]